ncbi:MAG: cytochrome c [Verrucomicrobiaceae bacterium]|nr:cytochrome c [Verrucomicrobiaceae bacterium]
MQPVTSLRSFFALASVLVMVARAGVAADPLTLDYSLYAQGKYIFERNCILCHGPRGDGSGELSKGLQPKPRSFREGMFKFRSTPYGALPTEDDLRVTIRGGLTGTAMGMFTQLQDDEVRAVIEYVKSFSRRWRKAENYAEAIPLPEQPKWFEDEKVRGVHADGGKQLFENICATCHGTKGDGNGPTAATLKDMWNLPCKPSDLRQPHLRCGDRPIDVYRVLATGLSGTPMISYEGALTETQRWDLIAYIQTLKLPDVPTLGSANVRR